MVSECSNSLKILKDNLVMYTVCLAGMFGDFKIFDEFEINLLNGKVVFKRINSGHLRIVKSINSSITSKVINLTVDEFISLRPKQPSGNMIKVNYLMIRFSEPLTLLPKTSTSVNLQLPTDLGVFVGDVLVDSIPLSKVKYALYGPSDIGDLCRYISKEVVDSTPKEFLGSMNVSITSTYADNLSISRVVIPVEGLAVFVLHDNEIRFNNVEVRCLSPLHVEVSTDSKTSLTPSEIRYGGRAEKSSYTMRFGV